MYYTNHHASGGTNYTNLWNVYNMPHASGHPCVHMNILLFQVPVLLLPCYLS